MRISKTEESIAALESILDYDEVLETCEDGGENCHSYYDNDCLLFEVYYDNGTLWDVPAGTINGLRIKAANLSAREYSALLGVI